MPRVVTDVVKTFGLHESLSCWNVEVCFWVVTTRFGLTFVFCSVHLDHHVVQLLLLHHADALRTHSEDSSSLICLFISRNQSSVGVWAQDRSVSNVMFRKLELLVCFLFPAWLIAEIHFPAKHLLLDEITQTALLQISESFCRTHTHTHFSSASLITEVFILFSQLPVVQSRCDNHPHIDRVSSTCWSRSNLFTFKVTKLAFFFFSFNDWFNLSTDCGDGVCNLDFYITEARKIQMWWNVPSSLTHITFCKLVTTFKSPKVVFLTKTRASGRLNSCRTPVRRCVLR